MDKPSSDVAFTPAVTTSTRVPGRRVEPTDCRSAVENSSPEEATLERIPNPLSCFLPAEQSSNAARRGRTRGTLPGTGGGGKPIPSH